MKVSHDVNDAGASVTHHNVHKRADELVQLVKNQIEACGTAAFSVCTHDVGVRDNTLALRNIKHNTTSFSCAAWPTLSDGNDAMRYPAIYGLLCTVFEWFRVAVDGVWSLGSYDMRYWDFLHSVAPVPYVLERDKNQECYVMCQRTGFRRWTTAAMLHRLQTRYCVAESTLSFLALVLPSSRV